MVKADANIYVYTFDNRDSLKQAIATQVVVALKLKRGPLPLQLVGELQNVLRRKLKAPPAFAAAEALELMRNHEVFGYPEAAVMRALKEAARGRLGYWDALMLAAAAEAGCTSMLSEDMQNGATLFGLEIVSPFSPAGVSARASELLGLA